MLPILGGLILEKISPELPEKRRDGGSPCPQELSLFGAFGLHPFRSLVHWAIASWPPEPPIFFTRILRNLLVEAPIRGLVGEDAESFPYQRRCQKDWGRGAWPVGSPAGAGAHGGAPGTWVESSYGFREFFSCFAVFPLSFLAGG